MPSLCFLGGGLLLLAAALMTGPIYRWAALALLAVAFLRARSKLPVTTLTGAVFLYCAWLVLNAEFVTQNYNSESLYRPLVLLAGFCTACAIGEQDSLRLFRAGVALTAGMVLLGFAQTLFGFWHVSPHRASAIFPVANTFATAINAFLLPLVALIVARRAGWWTWAAAAWLFAGLVSTESRGGYLAFVTGCLFVMAYCGLPEGRKGWIRTLGAAAAATAIAAVVATLYVVLGGSFGETLLSRGANLRPELASVAIGHLMDAPLAGAGAGMFPALYQMSKPPSLDNASHYFYVHNDYLQIWLEFGLLGIALLLALLLNAGYVLLRKRRDWGADPVPLAAGAGLVAVFAHAMVDFPLHVPYLLLVIGGLMAVLAMKAGPAPRLAERVAAAGARLGALRRRLPAIVVAFGLGWSALPAAAGLLADHSVRRLRTGDMEGGLYWQAVARFMEPRNGTHHWAEAVMWRELALETRRPGLAARADALFASGMEASPFDVTSHLQRARLHRLHADLLERPATAAQILAWTSEAARLRPYSPVVLGEHARSLVHAGRREEAATVVRHVLRRHPAAPASLRLASEIGLE